MDEKSQDSIKSVDDNQLNPNASDEAATKQGDPEPHVPKGISVAQLDPSETHQCGAANPKRGWWDKGKPFFEATGVVALCVYTGFTAAMYFVNKEAADAAKSAADTAAASIRPWLKIKSIDLRPGIGPIKTLMFHWPLTGAQAPPGLQLKVSLENLGHSVAQDIVVDEKLFFGKFTNTGWHDLVTQEEEQACRASKIQPPSSAINAVVFPSETLDSYGVPGALYPEEGSAAAVIVCVNYRGAPGTRYQTQAWSGLYENQYIIIPIGVDADVSVLRLIREQSGDHAE
jgi:hypothetical protein